jgi:hypothetical protein
VKGLQRQPGAQSTEARVSVIEGEQKFIIIGFKGKQICHHFSDTHSNIAQNNNQLKVTATNNNHRKQIFITIRTPRASNKCGTGPD